MASSWFVATGQQALGQLQVFTTHNPTCLNGITISTPLYQSVEVPVQHGIYIYICNLLVLIWFYGWHTSCFPWAFSVQLDPFDISSLTNPQNSQCMVISRCELPLIPWVPFEIVMFCRHFVLVTHDATNDPMKLPAILKDMAEGHPSKNGWSSYHQTSNA